MVAGLALPEVACGCSKTEAAGRAGSGEDDAAGQAAGMQTSGSEAHGATQERARSNAGAILECAEEDQRRCVQQLLKIEVARRRGGLGTRTQAAKLLSGRRHRDSAELQENARRAARR
eukprot:901290-Prymnesium_polylepis.1